MSSAIQTSTEIRPFRSDVPEQKLDDLRRRIAATRWPSKELVSDRSQGVQLEALQALTRYWLDEYDFGRIDSRLNALPQFVTDRRFVRYAYHDDGFNGNGNGRNGNGARA